jgi:membrane peptidoglycan carboxypeptidase
VAGVWVGNTDNKPMKLGADGSIVAGPIWNAFMSGALAGTPVETFKEPDVKKTGKAIIDGERTVIGTVQIDTRTGKTASSNTPAEFIGTKNLYDNHSILYYVDKSDPLGPVPTNPASDPQFIGWESAIATWAKNNNEYMSSSTPIIIDTASSTASTSEAIISTTTIETSTATSTQ